MVVEVKEKVTTPEREVTLTSPFSMIVDVVQNKEYEQVTVPGVLLQKGDCEFVAGVYHGRCSYFEEVYSLLDQDGKEVRSFTLAELAHLREVKTRDLTSADVIKLMMKTFSNTETTSRDWQVGFIFGYVLACSDQFYGLACDTCSKHQSECHCDELPPDAFQ